MISLTVNIDGASQVGITLQHVANADHRKAMASIGQMLVSHIKDNIDGHTGPAGGWPRSGLSDLWAGWRTWRDIKMAVHSGVEGDTVRVGVSHIAAAVRHLGTVGAGGTEPDIVPKEKKALTIPVSEAASHASYDGLKAREAFPDAFIKTAPGGQSAQNLAVICRTINKKKESAGRGKGQQIEILYLLVKRVAIRPHPFLPIDAAGQLSPASLWNTINDMLMESFIQSGGGSTLEKPSKR